MKPTKLLSVIVADDHPSIRYGVVSVLEDLEFISIIHSASNGIEVLKLLEKRDYDIVLMDIKMPVLDGVETTEHIVSKYPDVKVIALSMYTEERYVIEMMSKGAKGYLLKNADREVIIEALMTVQKGDKYISKEISDSVFNKLDELPKTFGKKKICHEEILREIIFLLSHDLMSKEIADILSFSKRTVDQYRRHISEKLEAKGLAGIINYAIEHGIRDDVLLERKFHKHIFERKAS